MKRGIIILLLFQFQVFPFLHCQEKEADSSHKLVGLFNRLALTNGDSARIRINDSIDNIISHYSRSDSVFMHVFTGIRYLGQIESPDAHLKIITWNLLLRNSRSRYYCYFINRTGKVNSVYRLSETYNDDPVRTDTIYSDAGWYGALYYDVRPVKKENKTYWLVLGVNYGNQSVTKKIIDVVTFDPDGKIIFGRKLFLKDQELSDRVVLEYSSDAVVSLKFISGNKIVFDHLVPFSPEFKNKREKYGPEFSYDGYVWDKGLWIYKENIDIRNKR